MSDLFLQTPMLIFAGMVASFSAVMLFASLTDLRQG